MTWLFFFFSTNKIYSFNSIYSVYILVATSMFCSGVSGGVRIYAGWRPTKRMKLQAYDMILILYFSTQRFVILFFLHFKAFLLCYLNCSHLVISLKEHCLMGIKGTVRRSTDGHIIHANIDTDVIIAEEPSYGKYSCIFFTLMTLGLHQTIWYLHAISFFIKIWEMKLNDGITINSNSISLSAAFILLLSLQFCKYIKTKFDASVWDLCVLLFLAPF